MKVDNKRIIPVGNYLQRIVKCNRCNSFVNIQSWRNKSCKCKKDNKISWDSFELSSSNLLGLDYIDYVILFDDDRWLNDISYPYFIMDQLRDKGVWISEFNKNGKPRKTPKFILMRDMDISHLKKVIHHINEKMQAKQYFRMRKDDILLAAFENILKTKRIQRINNE